MPHSLSLASQSPTRVEVDLTSFKENIKQLKKRVKSSTLLAVVKTNAYGHGITEIGRTAVEAGADRLGVTTVEEGALLREHGICVPIHLLSSVTHNRAADVVKYNLTASLSSQRLAKAISIQAMEQGKQAPVHLKIDTGLHRFGVDPDKAVNFCENCYHLPGLQWEGIYTHFSSADEADWETTEQQFALFMNTVTTLHDEGFTFPIRHVGASTIAIERPDMHLDMVRPGIALFGYPPESRQEQLISLKPVMTLKSQVLQVRELPPNTPIGYGGSYITKNKEKIAVIPVGHGDGYKRALSNKGEMLIKGQRVKIIGTISLDQTIVDVTHIPTVCEGDEVVLLGKQGDEEITARDIADWMDSIVDEVLASWMDRVQRVYV